MSDTFNWWEITPDQVWEQELTNKLAREVCDEIDREILADLRALTGPAPKWDFRLELGDEIKKKYASEYKNVQEVTGWSRDNMLTTNDLINSEYHERNTQ